MKQHSFRSEKEFGLIVGGVLALLSAWWLYRGKLSSISHFTLSLGFTLMLLGLIVPQALVFPNRVWMLLGEALGFLSTRIILALVFFLVITPIGLLKRMLGWDPLNRRAKSSDSYWKPYSVRQHDLHHYEKMY